MAAAPWNGGLIKCDCCLGTPCPGSLTLVAAPFPATLLALAEAHHPGRSTEELPDYLSMELCAACRQACLPLSLPAAEPACHRACHCL